MTFSVSYTPSGGTATEARQYLVSGRSLYCALGNWENSGPANGPMVIRRDSPGTPWAIETKFDPTTIACAAIGELPFIRGTVLAVGFFGRSQVGMRDPTGKWTTVKLGGGVTGKVQVRSFGFHVDAVTKAHLAFAGHDVGIFSGAYDNTAPGYVRWGAAPEIDISKFPTMSGGHPQRVTSFAEINGKLYAAVAQALYERQDGAQGTWKKVWTNKSPGMSQTGCRGLTAVDGALWVGVEGTNSRVASIDPRTFVDTTLYDVSGPNHYYQIVAYNNFAVVKAADGSEVVIAGLDGKQSGPARYIVRSHGAWCKRPISLPALLPHTMVSCRTIMPSPFSDGVLYWGGYDCNSNKSKDTAWCLESTVADATPATTQMVTQAEEIEYEEEEEHEIRFKRFDFAPSDLED